MPQFGCRCGRSISLVSIPLDNGAHIVRDSEWDSVCQAAALSVTRYLEAVRCGERDQFLEKFSWCAPDASEEEIIADFLGRSFRDKSLEAFQCSNCGRVWIEDGLAPDRFRSFLPDATWRGTFYFHPAGFLSYEAETTFYRCRLKKIKRRKDTIKVIFKSADGRRVVARFTGVKSVKKRIPKDSIPALNGLCVKYLGRWSAEVPYYRYVFEDYYNREAPGHLTIVAQGFKLLKGSTDGDIAP